jgi:hypothetical protein
MRHRSIKMARVYRQERVPLVKEMLAENPNCELFNRIRRVDPGYRSCHRHAIGLHELKKRSAGGSITDRDNVLRCCGPCNSFIEDSPDLAWRCGLVMRRGDTIEDVRRRWLVPEQP